MANTNGDRVIPPSRRRDKPQLSCNLCRRRKLRCDRKYPCGSCVRRGLSLSCTYPSHEGRAQLSMSNFSPSAQAKMSDRISQLENLVKSLVESRNDSSHGPPEPAAVAASRSSEDKSEAHLRDYFGHMVFDENRTSYVESIHWTAILDGMAELKNSFAINQEQRFRINESLQISDAHRPAILFGAYRSATREELLAAIPPRQVVDELVNYFFQHDLLATAIIHGPMFMTNYEQFWKRPFQTSVIWIGQLFAIISLASCHRDRRVPTAPESLRFEQTYCERIVQCLVLGNYSTCPPCTLETFLLYLDIKYQHCEADRIETWLVLGLIVRLALRMGYHRDPAYFPSINPYEAEMRRRTWAYIVLYDTFISGHIGLPRMLHDGQANTAEPANLMDEDFDSTTVVMPAPKPDTVITPAIFLVAKKKMGSVYGTICDLAISTDPIPPYDEVQRLHELLHKTYANIPDALKLGCIFPSSSSPICQDSSQKIPQLTLRQIFLATLLQGSKCILHKKHMALGRTETRYAASHTICIDAAIQILQIQKFLTDEMQTSGSLHGYLWKIPSLLSSAFYLAASVLCLTVNPDREESFSGQTAMADRDDDSEQRTRVIQVLSDAYNIWTQHNAISRESFKIIETLSRVLQSAKRGGGNSFLLDKLPESDSLHNVDRRQLTSLLSHTNTYTDTFSNMGTAIADFIEPNTKFPAKDINEEERDHINEEFLFNAVEFQVEDFMCMANDLHDPNYFLDQ